MCHLSFSTRIVISPRRLVMTRPKTRDAESQMKPFQNSPPAGKSQLSGRIKKQGEGVIAFSNGALIHRKRRCVPCGACCVLWTRWASPNPRRGKPPSGFQGRPPHGNGVGKRAKRRPAGGGIMAASERPDRTRVQPGQAGVTELRRAHFGTSGNCSENFENSSYHAPFGWLTRSDCHR